MAQRRPNPELYASPEWTTLRDAVLQRDGHCCRNCGSGEKLEVHHWLPLPEHREQVDERGYGQDGNPLIVHDSGLITVCQPCHEVLTERRTRQALLKHPELRRLGDPAKQSDNIFELRALNERQLPFKVRKDSWSKAVSQYYLIEKIEVTKWPYGKAWGRYVREGAEGEYGKVPNSGTYTWRIADD